MVFTVSANTLLKILQLASGVISTNNALPILDDFLFQIEEGQLTVTASDMETYISIKQDVMSDENGEIAIPARTLLDIIKGIPEQPVTFRVNMDTNMITLVSQNGKYQLPGDSGNDYPLLPEEEEVDNIDIRSSILNEAIGKTIFAVSNDELRPSMTGVLFQTDEDGLTFVATDAQKLVRYKNKEAGSEIPGSIIIPKKALSLLKNAMPQEDTVVQIAYNKTNCFFGFDNINIICRLIDGRYPNYEAVIPVDNPNKLVINRKDLQSSLRRLSVLANKSTHQVTFRISPEELELNSQDLDFSSEGKEHLPCKYEGDEMNIAFSAKYLSEILNAMDTEEIHVEMSQPSRAALILPPEKNEEEDLLMLIMPIMLAE